MASIGITRSQLSRLLLISRAGSQQKSKHVFENEWLIPAAIGGGLLGAIFLNNEVHASENLEPTEYPFPHSKFFGAYDTAALRRGYEVYRQVCSTCHSMSGLRYRHLIGYSHTEPQAKALAASYKFQDGPNDQGEMFTRPGILTDPFPKPYSNDEAARFANGGALPPDLTQITNGRHGGANYVLALLTGYRDPPVGFPPLRAGLHYNPYFPGGAISMAKALQDGGVEYEDGTPATVSQQAKDVATFLAWSSEMKQDERKLWAFRMMCLTVLAFLGTGYYKRFLWSIYKSRRISYIAKKI